MIAIRPVPGIVVALILFVASPCVAQLTTAAMPASSRELFQQHCLQCHDVENHEGNFRLDDLPLSINDVATADRWQKVLGVLNSGEMPPEGEKQISDSDKAAFLETLSKEMVLARNQLSDSGGAMTIRRLNRREYENTIYDLLGVRISAESLPDDSNAGGFDTAGASLFFSSDQFEQYVDLAHRALDEAITKGRKPTRKQLRRESEKQTNAFIKKRADAIQKKYDQAQAWRETKGKKKPSEFGFIDENDVKFNERVYRQQGPAYRDYLANPQSKSGMLLAKTFNGAAIDKVAINKNWPAGDYILRLRVASLPHAPSHERFIEYGQQDPGMRTGEMRVMGCVEVTASIDDPQVIEIPVSIAKDGAREFVFRGRQHNSRQATRSAYLKWLTKNKTSPPPTVWVDWIEIDGPIVGQWPPKGMRTIFPDGVPTKDDSEDEAARKIIKSFAERAFRTRAPSSGYLEKLFDVYASSRSNGSNFDEAIREPLAVVLSSPGFLYLSEPSKNGEKRSLTNDELAVRLSYFLWSGPPDDKLLSAAKRGRLTNNAALRWHASRMLDDPRAMEFISSFAHQWLHMERLDFFQFDSAQYPEFDESVKTAARLEVYETIRHMINKKRPLGELLRSDYVVINSLLADYYQIDNVTGSEFRVINVPNDSPRGGLVGMIAILAMGSDGQRSSPVERGAWVMRKLLNDPPPPAPANVPQLSRLSQQILSSRELQKAHMEQPQCAQCHRKIDPIGYGLENFDAAGRWRESELVVQTMTKRKKRQKEFPIDSSGTLPDGSEFGDYFQLRDALASKDEEFAIGFTEALIEYGLGRKYSFSDQKLRDSIITTASEKNMSMREFLLAFIQSDAFRSKR